MRIKFLAFTIIAMAASSSCTADAGRNPNQDENQRPTIVLPTIPDDLREPTQRAQYLILNYWNNLDLADTSVSHNKELLEQSLVDFLSIIPYSPSEEIAVEGYVNLLKKIKPDKEVYRLITDLTEDYLNNAHSPLKDEDGYLIYLKSLESSGLLSTAEKLRVEDRIKMISKNRPGTQAADFEFLKETGERQKLSGLYSKNKGKLMLIFFDPECEHCDETLNKIINDETLTESLSSGDLEIATIYCGDNKNSWKEKIKTFPSNWINGINDGDVEEEELYYLPSLPSIYLLDSNGMVLEKDLQF